MIMFQDTSVFSNAHVLVYRCLSSNDAVEGIFCPCLFRSEIKAFKISPYGRNDKKRGVFVQTLINRVIITVPLNCHVSCILYQAHHFLF